MDAALVILPVVKKNRKTWKKTILANNQKVKNLRKDPNDTNYTLVYYSKNDFDRRKVVEFKVALTVTQTEVRLDEKGNDELAIPVYVTKKGSQFGILKTVNRVEYLPIGAWVYAYNNSDNLSCTLWMDEGAFKLVEYKLAHTIEQISSRASLSASFSEAGI
jgi:hypothetical protein